MHNSFFYKNRTLIATILFVLTVGLLTTLVTLATWGGSFFLEHEDEAIYYGCAKLFKETNSVQAAGCNEERVAVFGNINWYGPGFHVVYGMLFKIFGDRAVVFPLFHFVLALVSLALVFRLPLPMELRLIFALALALSQQLFVYVFTFFPETLIVFCAVILTLLLAKQYYVQDDRLRKQYEVAFVICTLFFTIFRITFIFWLSGWVALAETRSSLFKRLAVFVVAIAGSLVYMKFFLAPTWATSLKKVDLLYSWQLYDFVVKTFGSIMDNVKSLVYSRPSAVNILIGMLIASAVASFATRSRLILAAFTISTLLIITLLAYYVVDGFFFVKQTAMLIPLLFLGLIAGLRSMALSYSLIIILLAIFPGTILKAIARIDERREAHTRRENFKTFEEALAGIPAAITPDPTVILWCYNEYDYGRSAEALLPFATTAKKPILYTTNVVSPDSDVEIKFARHNLLKVDYILSRNPLDWPTLQEIHRTSFYFLYKLNK